MIMDEVLDLHVLNLLKREVTAVSWSTIVYNIFIDTDVVPIGFTRQVTRSTRTQITNERGNNCFNGQL